MEQTPPLDALKTDPAAQKLLGDPAALRALLTSPETQTLLSLLRQGGGDLQGAAQAAARGNPQALQALLGRVTASAEGARAVEELTKRAGN